MAVKIHCAESGYFLEVDGQFSSAHRYGYSCIFKGPSGTMYGAHLDEEPEPGGPKSQLYRLTPIDSLAELDLADDGIEYEELPDEDDEDAEEGEDGHEVEVEEEVEGDDDDDEADDTKP